MSAQFAAEEALALPSNLVTLQTHMLAEERRSPNPTGALSWICSALSISAKAIAATLKRAGLEDVLGDFGRENIQGETQQKLDVIANNILMRVLGGRDGVAVLGSEEDECLVYQDNGVFGGERFAVLFDPLDGSANLDVCGGVGTIFSIYKIPPSPVYALQSGREQIAAGYVLYGSSSVMVLATDQGVSMFVLDPSVGAFLRVAENMRIPQSGKIYSVNEANVDSFPRGYQAYLDACHQQGYTSRYGGAMVADVHRVLLKGGVFLYPPTTKAPSGKLRLMYECNPMAKIITQAGGMAVTGHGDVLDVSPSALHQRVPVVLGSPDNVNEVLSFL